MSTVVDINGAAFHLKANLLTEEVEAVAARAVAGAASARRAACLAIGGQQAIALRRGAGGRSNIAHEMRRS